MAKRRKKAYFPAEAQLGYSGVHKKDLKQTLKELEAVGAHDIVVSDDDGEYEDEGPYYLVDYRR